MRLSSIQSVLIVGCGYVGKKIAAFFLKRGVKVYGIVRTARNSGEIAALKIRPIVLDLKKKSSLKAIPETDLIVLCPSPGRDQSYKDIYDAGIQNLILCLRQKKYSPRLVIYLSSTGIWGDKKGGWVDERETLYGRSEKSRILARAEDRVLNSGFPAIVFRLGGIYGPGRNRIRKIRDAGGKPKAKRPDTYLNLIHVEDIVRAVALLIEKGKPGQVVLGVDGHPVKSSEYYRWLYNKLGRPYPDLFDESKTLGKRCPNKRLKSLGFELKYPSYRKGYQTLL